MASQKTLTCSVCKEVKGTTLVRYKKLEARGILNTYLCRDCKAKGPKVKKSTAQCQITCTKCGTDKATTRVRYEKLAKEGKIEGYICRDCRPKKTKKPYVSKRKAKVEGEVDVKTSATGLSDAMKNWTPRAPEPKYNAEDYKKINTCFRPDHFFGNKALNKGEGCCNNCPMLESCGCLTKVIAKDLDKKTKSKSKKK